MAAFSGHREDGDELLGCCFSVAYSHVKERWWEKRGEDELSFWRRGSVPSAVLAGALQCRDVLPPCVSSVISVPLNPDETKHFFSSMSRGDEGDTLRQPPQPLCLNPIPDHWNSLFLSGKTLPMQPGKNAPPSAPSHLLFVVCFLTFISNSFHWHMKSWQGRDTAREGMEWSDEGMEREGYSFSLLVITALPHAVNLEQRTNSIWQPRSLPSNYD